MYFTKYLPVDDQPTDTNNTIIHRDLNTAYIFCAPKIVAQEAIRQGDKLAKLFLCSRDINIGESFYWRDMLSPNLWSKEYQQDKETHDEFAQVVFKVIGEISPDATHIKEGDKFGEEDIANILIPSVKSKTYFAKYLVVSGKVQDGDKVLYEGKIYSTTIPDRMREPKRLLIYIPENCNHIVYTNQPKVSLYLCTKDIKAGDKVKIDVLDNGILNDFTYKEDGEEDGIRYRTFEGVGIFIDYPDIENNTIFKVIGEISDTLSVKEGDLFEDKDIDHLLKK